jgi:hypothetical protein
LSCSCLVVSMNNAAMNMGVLLFILLNIFYKVHKTHVYSLKNTHKVNTSIQCTPGQDIQRISSTSKTPQAPPTHFWYPSAQR